MGVNGSGTETGKRPLELWRSRFYLFLDITIPPSLSARGFLFGTVFAGCSVRRLVRVDLLHAEGQAAGGDKAGVCGDVPEVFQARNLTDEITFGDDKILTVLVEGQGAAGDVNEGVSRRLIGVGVAARGQLYGPD